MPNCLIKLVDDQKREWYMEWSTISAAPRSYGMSLDELHDYIREEYGREGLRELPERLARIKKTGTSFVNDEYTVDLLIHSNRAGRNPGEREHSLTKAQIIERFCHQRPKKRRK